MKGLVIAFFLGVVVATVGFGGVARMLDSSINTVKSFSQEMAK